jgi:hypothetical protein
MSRDVFVQHVMRLDTAREGSVRSPHTCSERRLEPTPELSPLPRVSLSHNTALEVVIQWEIGPQDELQKPLDKILIGQEEFPTQEFRHDLEG